MTPPTPQRLRKACGWRSYKGLLGAETEGEALAQGQIPEHRPATGSLEPPGTNVQDPRAG